MRKKKKFRRVIKPDKKYNNITLAKFINQTMQAGKKSTAERIVYSALDKLGENSLEVFNVALANVAPQMELMSRRIGGANYQIPKEVSPERRKTLAIRWIIAAAKKKKGKPMAERLALEIKDASQNTGDAFKKKENMHKMAEANRAFAHFAY